MTLEENNWYCWEQQTNRTMFSSGVKTKAEIKFILGEIQSDKWDKNRHTLKV